MISIVIPQAAGVGQAGVGQFVDPYQVGLVVAHVGKERRLELGGRGGYPVAQVVIVQRPAYRGGWHP